MNLKIRNNSKGLTIIELLIAFVIFAMLIAGIYRFFVVQGRAYSVQDHVVETQQNIRSSMEILLKDLRMAGYDDDASGSQIIVSSPIIPGVDHIIVEYEYDPTTRYSVKYWRDEESLELRRQVTTYSPSGIATTHPIDVLLDNVEEVHFTYGLDTNGDDALDSWVEAGDINPGDKIVAIRVRVTSRPEQSLQETQKMMSPRTLETTVALRNLCLRLGVKDG